MGNPLRPIFDQRELQEAAVKDDAFNPAQLVTLLKPMTTFEAVKVPMANRPASTRPS